MTSSFSTSVQYVYLRLRSINKYSNGTPYAYTLLFIVCLLETVYIKVSKLSGLIVPRTLMSTGNFTLGWFRYRYYHVNSINQGKKNVYTFVSVVYTFVEEGPGAFSTRPSPTTLLPPTLPWGDTVYGNTIPAQGTCTLCAGRHTWQSQ